MIITAYTNTINYRIWLLLLVILLASIPPTISRCACMHCCWSGNKKFTRSAAIISGARLTTIFLGGGPAWMTKVHTACMVVLFPQPFVRYLNDFILNNFARSQQGLYSCAQLQHCWHIRRRHSSYSVPPGHTLKGGPKTGLESIQSAFQVIAS